ncbi:MAG: 16S rRNA (uracil(1498)-N(3))-methyltransferase [Gammaproteobacteria bacterium]|nr:16S rRNA (uracil(1498)-N(3))-methyltransferase [Gammaproteobacteria bacterium]MCP5199656.1 16S rRNA (uracil(1498)-N(3))-methyltransferase [Gammaproteobacteria bacterium]
MSGAPRVFVDCALAAGAEVVLPAVSAHHVRTVLRLARNAELVLLDGHGAVHEAQLTLVSREAVQAVVGPALAVGGESPLDVTLVQSISRGERMDYTLQKAVELGVRHVVPVTSRRTVVKLDSRREDRRLEHWRGVIRHAAEQSERTLLPTLAAVTTLDAWLAAHPTTIAFLLQPGAATPLAREPRPQAAVALLAGPEGGFDAGEVERMLGAGARAVSLGPRVLRTETAALAALAVMQALWGDFA